MNNIREARIAAGLTQAEMSRIFEIPTRTIEHWEAGTRKPPAYVEKLVLAKLKRHSQNRFYAANNETLISELCSVQNTLWELREDMKSLGINDNAISITSNAIDMIDNIVLAIEEDQE